MLIIKTCPINCKRSTFSLNDAFSHCAISFEIMMAQFGLLIKIKSYYNRYE